MLTLDSPVLTTGKAPASEGSADEGYSRRLGKPTCWEGTCNIRIDELGSAFRLRVATNAMCLGDYADTCEAADQGRPGGPRAGLVCLAKRFRDREVCELFWTNPVDRLIAPSLVRSIPAPINDAATG